LQAEPLRPSDVAPPERQKTLRGDLDRILLKTLEKKPDARYTSVGALADDIARFLAGRPVLARQGGRLYRLRQFVRRRNGSVAAAPLAIAMLAVIFAQTVTFAISTARQSEAIARERDVSTEIRDFLLGVFAVSDPNEARGETITARELLDRGAERLQNELREQPGTRAVLLSAIAKIYAQLGLYDRAEPLYDEALSLHRELSGEVSPAFAAVLEDYTELTQIMGDYAAAEAFARRVVSIERQLEDPEGIARSLNALGRVLHLQGSYDAAEPHYRDALAIYRSMYGEDNENVALSLSHLGALAAHRGQYEIAEDLQTRVLAVRRKIYGSEHLRLIGSLNNLADLSQNLGKYDEAIAFYEEALAINHKLLPEDHSDNAFLHNGLGVVYRKLGNYEEAETHYRKAIAIREKSVGREHPEVANTMANLAKLLLLRGDAVAAVPVYREAFAILSRATPDDPYVYAVQSMLGRSLSETAHFSEAEGLILAGHRGLLAAYGSGHRWTREASDNLVQLYEAWGRPAAAELYRAMQPVE
jgi:serine/threonine-protein kinase